jgi:hypothetical protein
VAEAATKAAAVAQARAVRWADLDALRTSTAAACTSLLDALEMSLSAVGSGPFAGGLEAYSVGDAFLTVFLSLMSASALVPGGIRIGTPAMTTRGFKEADFKTVGDLIHRGIVIASALSKHNAAQGGKLKEFNAAVEAGTGEAGPAIAALRHDVETLAGSFFMPGGDL